MLEPETTGDPETVNPLPMPQDDIDRMKQALTGGNVAIFARADVRALFEHVEWQADENERLREQIDTLKDRNQSLRGKLFDATRGPMLAAASR